MREFNTFGPVNSHYHYTAGTSQAFTPDAIDTIYLETEGQPFLVKSRPRFGMVK